MKSKMSSLRAAPQGIARTSPGMAIGIALMVASGCAEPPDLTLPTEDEISSYFQSSAPMRFEIDGNVAVITVEQDNQHLRRGGRLWAKVGPYIYLFTPATQDLLTDYPGLGGVRVSTTTESGTQVATALLPREALNDLTWKRAVAIAGRARVEGTSKVTLLESLIEFGEPRTEHEYNPRFIRR